MSCQARGRIEITLLIACATMQGHGEFVHLIKYPRKTARINIDSEAPT